eukprot:jgi/Tetstr1/462241/TSEL_000639.t1
MAAPLRLPNLAPGSLKEAGGRHLLRIPADFVTCTTAALEQFHAQNPGVALQVDVARRPFSFRGGSGRREPAPDPRAATWLEGLKNYYPGYYEDGECCTLKRLGRNAKIEFDFETEFNWHPVDSQRMLLWAMTQGRGEDFAEAMAKRHFRAAQVGGGRTVDPGGGGGGWPGCRRGCCPAALTQTADEAWTMRAHSGATHPQEEDDEIKPHTINGSADPSRFLDVFEAIAREAGAPLS